MQEHELNHNLVEHIFTSLHTKNQEQALQMAAEIRKFMDEMPGGFLIYHADGKEEIIYANLALLRIFQCADLAEFRSWTGNSFQGIVHPDDLKAVEISIAKQVAESQYDLDYVEYRIIRRDGSIGWVEDHGHFIHSDAGDIFYVFISDATEKRNRLAQKEERFQNLIEQYDQERSLINQEYLRRLEVIEGLSVNYESILYADLDTDNILPYRLSSRTKHQFGEKFQERSFLWYTSDYVKTWVHSEDREALLHATSPDYIRKKLKNRKTYYINYRIFHEKRLQYLQLRVVNVGSKEHISQVVLGYRRVDEEVQREMEQNQLLEEALSHANLAIMAKNTFLSNMSHDMRTPLNAILGYTALAKTCQNDEDALLSYLHKIEVSSRQLLELIEKVLEISWSEANDTKIEETEYNLCDIMQELYDTMLARATDKDVQLSMNTANLQHCSVYCDAEKLKQALSYILQNAITYTHEGGHVAMSVTEPDSLPNDSAVYTFTIKDTGIGMSQEFLDHVFEPFEREKNTTLSGIHGTGLGLTIAKNIIDRMGGTIKASSAEGVGSTFTVTLRFRVQNHPHSFSGYSEDVIFWLMNKKILLVEDNEINSEIETEILRVLGFSVEHAVNGSIAVDKIRRSSPGEYALILMDIQMPVMDGREATRAIRALGDPALSRLPIIALSADAYESDIHKSLESGMDAHLTKPVDVPLLLETIVKTIHKYHMLP